MGGPTRTSADVSVPRLARFSLITDHCENVPGRDPCSPPPSAHRRASSPRAGGRRKEPTRSTCLRPGRPCLLLPAPCRHACHARAPQPFIAKPTRIPRPAALGRELLLSPQPRASWCSSSSRSTLGRASTSPRRSRGNYLLHADCAPEVSIAPPRPIVPSQWCKTR